MFYIEDQDGNRHRFHSEAYARGFLKATYNEKLWEFEHNPERYEVQGKALTNTEYRISVKDKSRLYFLDRAADIKNVVYSARLGRQVKGVLA